jgi:hypothetical protein
MTVLQLLLPQVVNVYSPELSGVNAYQVLLNGAVYALLLVATNASVHDAPGGQLKVT